MTNQQLQQRKQAVFARGQGNLYPVYVQQAKNAEVWDVEGNRFIDFGTGIAVCNTGHAHPKVVAAAQAQLARFSHSCLMINPYAEAVELAEKLTRLAPGSSAKKAIFVSTGAEAVENCIKIARAYTRRRGVIAFSGGFHGRTNLTMALTGKVAPYKNLFGPFPADIYHVPFPMALHHVSTEQSLAALHNLFKVAIAPEDVAAIIIEPVQGEGGFYQAPTALLQALRQLCDQHGIVLIADEIQTGFGRTGKMFAMQHSDVEPDLITMAKGIAGGLPLAAVVGKSEIMDAPLPGGLGGTYGGSPVACAAALAVLDVIEQDNLCQQANLIGEVFAARLTALQQAFPQRIAQVRQLGAMIAIEFMQPAAATNAAATSANTSSANVTSTNVNSIDVTSTQPAAALTQQIISKAAAHGLILLSCGFYGNVLRFLPPLTIEAAVLQEGLDKLDVLLRSVLNAES